MGVSHGHRLSSHPKHLDVVGLIPEDDPLITVQAAGLHQPPDRLVLRRTPVLNREPVPARRAGVFDQMRLHHFAVLLSYLRLEFDEWFGLVDNRQANHLLVENVSQVCAATEPWISVRSPIGYIPALTFVRRLVVVPTIMSAIPALTEQNSSG